MKPTIVLVHAAFADSNSWAKVILGLRAQGFPVFAPQIPLTSISDDAAALRRALERVPGPAIVVAHSYSGAVITAATGDLPNVKGLVYFAAMAPDRGETVIDILHREPHPMGPALAPDAHSLVWMSDEGFTNAVAPDSSPDEIALMIATQKPIGLAAITEPMGEPAWRTKPSWFLLAKRDRVIVENTQRHMATRMGAHVTEQDVDHTPLSSAPHLVESLILEAAHAAV